MRQQVVRVRLQRLVGASGNVVIVGPIPELETSAPEALARKALYGGSSPVGPTYGEFLAREAAVLPVLQTRCPAGEHAGSRLPQPGIPADAQQCEVGGKQGWPLYMDDTTSDAGCLIEDRAAPGRTCWRGPLRQRPRDPGIVLINRLRRRRCASHPQRDPKGGSSRVRLGAARTPIRRWRRSAGLARLCAAAGPHLLMLEPAAPKARERARNAIQGMLRPELSGVLVVMA